MDGQKAEGSQPDKKAWSLAKFLDLSQFSGLKLFG